MDSDASDAPASPVAMRVVLIASAPPAARGLGELLCAMGHAVPAVIAIRAPAGRYGPDYPQALHDVVPDADLFFVRSGERIAELLAAYDPDVALCASFPALIPERALGVPRLGIINGHPGSLPRYRGPNPMGWALRNGDDRIGSTLHRMTAEFDRGPILAEGSFPVPLDEDPPIALQNNQLWGALLDEALARVAAGDPGRPQDEREAGYAGPFEAGYIEVDWTRTAREIHDQARAWSLAPPVGGVRGPLTTLDGRRVRLVRTRLDDREGGIAAACADEPIWILETEPAPDVPPAA